MEIILVLKKLIGDIAVTTGGKVVSKDKGMTMDKLSLEWLGEANLVTVEDKIIKQFAYTKGDRHKITLKKLCESKKDVKKRLLESPDFADGYILKYYRKEIQRLEENEVPDMNEGYGGVTHRGRDAGSKAISLPASTPDYSMESYMRGVDE